MPDMDFGAFEDDSDIGYDKKNSHQGKEKKKKKGYQPTPKIKPNKAVVQKNAFDMLMEESEDEEEEEYGQEEVEEE